MRRSDWVRREIRREANGFGMVRWIGESAKGESMEGLDEDEAPRVDGLAEIMCDRIRAAMGEGANFDEAEVVDDDEEATVWRRSDEVRIVMCVLRIYPAASDEPHSILKRLESNNYGQCLEYSSIRGDRKIAYFKPNIQYEARLALLVGITHKQQLASSARWMT